MEAARAEADLAPAIPQIWRAEVQSLRADLRGWLQQKALLEADWTPEFYELSFGLKNPTGRDPRSRKEAVTVSGGYQLQGSIDLVERRASGMLRVVDHKTGRIPDPRPETVGKGEVLQPTLYALAAEAMLGEPVAVGRLYYSTIAQNYTAIDVPAARLDAPPRAARARGDRRGHRQRHTPRRPARRRLQELRVPARLRPLRRGARQGKIASRAEGA